MHRSNSIAWVCYNTRNIAWVLHQPTWLEISVDSGCSCPESEHSRYIPGVLARNGCSPWRTLGRCGPETGQDHTLADKAGIPMTKLHILLVLFIFLAGCSSPQIAIIAGAGAEAPAASDNTQTATGLTTEVVTVTPHKASSPATTVTATPPARTALPRTTPTLETWYQPLDSSYAQLGYSYARVLQGASPLYASLEDAAAQSQVHRHSPGVPTYVTYRNKTTRNGQAYYEVNESGWMRGEDLEELTPSAFSGLLLTNPPNFRFGWVLKEARSQTVQGQPVSTYQRYQVIREDTSAGSIPGYVAVGPDEWLPENAVALLTPQGTPPVGLDTCRWIQVSLRWQTLSVYQDCRLVFATLISSGQKPGWTYPGLFHIFQKYEYRSLSAPSPEVDPYYFEKIPYVLYYAGSWALHGAYWHDQFGSPASHGCINLSPADARWLFEWASTGDKVYVTNE